MSRNPPPPLAKQHHGHLKPPPGFPNFQQTMANRYNPHHHGTNRNTNASYTNSNASYPPMPPQPPVGVHSKAGSQQRQQQQQQRQQQQQQQQQQQRLLQLQIQQHQLQLQKLQQQQQQQQQQQFPSSSSRHSLNGTSSIPSPRNSIGGGGADNRPSPRNSIGSCGSIGTAPAPLQRPVLSPTPVAASAPQNTAPPAFVSKPAPPRPDPTNASASDAIMSSEQLTRHLLSQCDWKDKTLWVARQLMGGNSVNGFLRATATVQRIKKQRARQLTKRGDAAAAETKHPNETAQQAEERLKKEVMNPRTAKKIKSELEQGLQFCATLHNTVRSILYQMDPTLKVPPALDGGDETAHAKQWNPSSTDAASNITMPPPNRTAINPTIANASSGTIAPSTNNIPYNSNGPHVVDANKTNLNKNSTSNNKTAAAAPTSKTPQTGAPPQPGKNRPNKDAPGGPSGSTLRKHRRKKIVNPEPFHIQLTEFDASGKRNVTKKEHTFRLFDILRFRALRRGDLVAARLSSRDLWILARVQADYPSANMPHLEFLQLTEARRDALFRDKVFVKDVEEKEDGGATMVARSLVIPLPRNYGEAAEWGVRYKKGSRVYAMYPRTTSLYCATVIDNTTYCREDDDIIVVEFDGDEPDPATGSLPQYHIPARFVTLIPREFPGAQTNRKRKSSSAKAQQEAKKAKGGGGESSDDALNDMLNEMAYDDFSGGVGSLDMFDLEFEGEASSMPSTRGQPNYEPMHRFR